MIRDKGETCETNRFGSMKFHYCSQVVRAGITETFHVPFFKDEGAGSEACIKNKPAPQPRECTKSERAAQVSDGFSSFI